MWYGVAMAYIWHDIESIIIIIVINYCVVLCFCMYTCGLMFAQIILLAICFYASFRKFILRLCHDLCYVYWPVPMRWCMGLVFGVRPTDFAKWSWQKERKNMRKSKNWCDYQISAVYRNFPFLHSTEMEFMRHIVSFRASMCINTIDLNKTTSFIWHWKQHVKCDMYSDLRVCPFIYTHIAVSSLFFVVIHYSLHLA